MFLSLKKRTAIFISVVSFVLLDRLLKTLAVGGFFNPPVDIIGGFFKINFVANPYIAFSLPVRGVFINAVVIFAIIALVYFMLFSWRKRRFNEACVFFAIILGGASNLADRLKFGYVIDYFDLRYFTVFNLADVMIVFGVIWLGWMLRLDKTENIV